MKISISKENTILTKEYLLTQKENQYFERKGFGEKDCKPSKIAEELIGMLNADGGVLVFGISDDGQILDLKKVANLNDYRKIVYDYITPPSNIRLEEVEIDGNLIFLYHVEQDIERVFSRKDNEKIFLRVADSNRELGREQVRKLEYDKNIRRFEEELVEDFDIEDFDTTLLEVYKQKLNYQGEIFELLKQRHLAIKKENNYIFKKSAVLLFSKDPEKYIPSASVRYIRYEGVLSQTGTNHNVIKDQRFENNIPNLITELHRFIKITLKEYYFLDLEIGKFIKVPEYPEEAWLEGIVNALCHRSYNVQGSAIYIKHFDDRIEISNSGPLPAQVTVDNIKTERFARNPRIARVLEDLGYVRQLNEGVARIYESMEKSMLSVPEYRVQNGNVYLILKNKISEHSKTISAELINKIERQWSRYTDIQKQIISTLFINHKLNIKQIDDKIGANEKTIRRYLNEFIKNGIMEKDTNKIRDINAVYKLKKT
ncbi:ATP-binding protein [Riemerella anatipestifer]|uniref:ATP-binding protein n=1 Tax=Riemerella anatipestifer TaxID=34085 RepID=UPI00069C4903|nr:ATP-binding protein [Riemerella anatipestifer]MDY3351231.1 ATP-binding protein [Riemerella anatipestifer]MDY3529809.1 ATP-binding protein [Riemerella anatipestifer]MRM83264.1 ATPase [Riemerella anatipestifer]